MGYLGKAKLRFQQNGKNIDAKVFKERGQRERNKSETVKRSYFFENKWFRWRNRKGRKEWTSIK